MFFFSVSVCNSSEMADNNPKNNSDKVTLGRVSQTASVQCERATTRTMRPLVNDNLFDGSQKILELRQPTTYWLHDVPRYSGLASLCPVAYMTISTTCMRLL